ncbi:MAG TPA: hypothetical protein PKN52_00090 [Trueperaceae bacterium]|nr:hypothetical protein [Trueperaceae bacterium]
MAKTPITRLWLQTTATGERVCARLADGTVRVLTPSLGQFSAPIELERRARRAGLKVRETQAGPVAERED